jgi:DNA-binding transcriptional ArsR family regulator
MESGAKERGVPAPANRALAHALKHPLRVRIAAELEKRGMSPQQLADTLDEPLSLVAYHCDVLAAVGSVRGR